MKKSKRLTEFSVRREIILEVLKELPVKSLLRFRCVSKLWCSLIDGPFFIESHQTRSRTRPGGMNILLLVLNTRNLRYDLYSADPEGGPTTHFLTLPLVDCINPLQSVNGLVYFGNRIINPSTRESHVLPPLTIPCEVSSGFSKWNFFSCNYFGFDPSTKKYKVLNKWTRKGRRSQYQRAQYKILTLGTNSWREIDFKIEGNTRSGPCYIKGVIYTLFHIASSNQNVILGFEVEHEKFRIIHLPNDATEDHYMLSQVRENAALIDHKYTTIWILEDSDEKVWKKENFMCPPGWRGRIFDFVVGTVHTSEILLYDGLSTLSYYDLESRKWRDCRLSNFPGDLLSRGFRITNYVESLFGLKEM